MNPAKNVVLTTKDGHEKLDATMKGLLSCKAILARIMKRFVPEFAECDLDTIETELIEPESVNVGKTGVEKNTTNVIHGQSNEDTSNNEGRIFYDIIFRACYPDKSGGKIGIYINLEAQNSYYTGYPLEKRGMYYAARKYASQLSEINKDTNYGKLEKVYSIWLCMGNVPNYEANTVTLYRTEKYDIMGNVERARTEYDMMNVIMLRLNDDVKIQDNVLKLLQTLCSRKTSKEEKMSALEAAGIQDEIAEKEVIHMCNYSAYVEEYGREQGHQQGLQEGRQEGQTEKAKQMAMEMLRDGMSYEVIAKYAHVSVETIKTWEQESCCVS